MAGKFMALVWASACGVFLVAAFLLLGANIMFAMMAAARKDDDAVPAERRTWGPR